LASLLNSLANFVVFIGFVLSDLFLALSGGFDVRFVLMLFWLLILQSAQVIFFLGRVVVESNFRLHFFDDCAFGRSGGLMIHDVVMCPYLTVGACAGRSLGAGSLLDFIFSDRRLMGGR